MTEFESANFIILIRVSLCWTNRVAAALELELDRRFGHRTTPIRHKMNDCAFAEVLLAKVSKWHFGQSNQSCEWANEKAASKYHLGNLPKKFQNCRESNFIENRRRLYRRNFLLGFQPTHFCDHLRRKIYTTYINQFETVPELIWANALRAEIFKFSTFVVVAIFQRLHPASTPDWAKRERGLM